MKVLSIVTNRYSNFYQNQVSELKKRGIDVQTLAPSGQSTDHEVRANMSRSATDYVRLYKDILLTQTDDYDIVHANNGLVAPLALASLHRPVVLTFWGSDLMSSNTKLCQKSAKYADQVILPSESMSPYLSSDYTLIPFGVDTDTFTPMPKDDSREIVGWNKDDDIVLFPCSKSRSVKNYPLAERVVDQIDSAELHSISGLPHDEVPIYMNAADVVLVTSKRESGPMVIKEAALCNTPVVSTDVGFAESVLSNVSNSFVCKSEKQLIKKTEYILEHQLGSDGAKFSYEWSLERMGNKLEDTFSNLLFK